MRKCGAFRVKYVMVNICNVYCNKNIKRGLRRRLGVIGDRYCVIVSRI